MKKGIKRLFDLVFAVLVGIIALPIVGIFMLVVKIASPESPVIFKQERVGYKGKRFTILKLRSMTMSEMKTENYFPTNKD